MIKDVIVAFSPALLLQLCTSRFHGMDLPFSPLAINYKCSEILFFYVLNQYGGAKGLGEPPHMSSLKSRVHGPYAL